MGAAPAAETRPDMLKGALWYAERGFPVSLCIRLLAGDARAESWTVNIPVSIPEPRTDSRTPRLTRTP
jgi:hypothetical protein